MKKYILFLFIAFLWGCQEEGIKPICVITSPQNNDSFKKGEEISVLIEAYDEDGLIKEVGLLVDNIVLNTIDSEPFSFSLNTNDLEIGEHTINVYAVDNEGLSSSAIVNIFIEVFGATIETDTVKNLTSNTATFSGKITDSGGASITETGFCWGTEANPTIDNYKKIIENGVDTLVATIDSLESNTTYHVRAYAINESGVAYGNEIVFKTPFELGSFRDPRDGNIYKTVKIGDKWWLAENLRFLPDVFVPTTGSDSIGYKYVYGQTACGCMGKARANPNYIAYGTLYNWPAAISSVPEGWHLPSNNEWDKLADFISNANGAYINTGELWKNIANHIKSKSGWNNDSTNIDDYGFSCLPGGQRDAETKNFVGVDSSCYFWTANEKDKTHAWGRKLISESSSLHRSTFQKNSGFSVRCVMD